MKKKNYLKRELSCLLPQTTPPSPLPWKKREKKKNPFLARSEQKHDLSRSHSQLSFSALM